MKLYDLVKVLDDDKGVVIKGKANDTLFSGKVIDLKKDKYFSMLKVFADTNHLYYTRLKTVYKQKNMIAHDSFTSVKMTYRYDRCQNLFKQWE